MATLAPPGTSPGHPATVGATSPRTDLRPDIQALRALAVVGVLIYHANPALLPGGLVGVDVFFVLSGYLISSHLIAELERTGSIALGRFWARRARRLLPASLAVLAATAVGVLVLVPEALRQRFLGDIAAAALYCANWLFAAQSVDYFGQAEGAGTGSPVLHFWSLGVEEQLYALWPLLLLGAWTLAGRRLRPRAALLGAVLLVGVPSFALGAVLVAQGDPTAYFATTTRAWEFGAGALVGLALLRRPAVLHGAPLRLAAACAGWAALVVYMVQFRAELGFPGLNAVVPVAATALVIWAGDPHGPWSPSALLRARPVQLVGATSYGIYLWHWPVLVLLPFALTAGGFTDTPQLLTLGWWEVAVVGLAVLGLAWLTLHLVEDPVRFSPRVRQLRPRAVLGAALAATVVVAGTAVAAGAAVARDLDQRRAASQSAEDALVQRAVPRTAPSGAGPSAAAPVWDDVTCRGPASLVEKQCAGFTWPDLIPAVGVQEETAADIEPIRTSPGTSSCLSSHGDFGVHDCVYGVPGGTRIALVGDSHAFHLLPAFEAVARRNNLELHLFARSGCPLTQTPRSAPAEQVAGCLAWSRDVQRALVDARFRTVVVSSFAGLAFQDASPARGFEAAWEPLVESGAEVVVVRDTPSLGQGRWGCVQSHPDDVSPCARPMADALANDDGRLEAAKALGLRVIDLTTYFCRDGLCPAAVGGVRVYRDANHLTGTYSLLLAPYLARALLPLR